jgi:peptidyl-prolyl cis-trans isomerase B (cyclophilin B)
MEAASAVVAIFSILIPVKAWFTPTQPIEIDLKTDQEVVLMLTDFAGTAMEGKGADAVKAGRIDLKQIFPTLGTPGTYILYAVPKGKEVGDFVGTPLVISVRADGRAGAPPGPMVVKVSPLQYAVIHTPHGTMTAAFYYDVAPNTVANFLTLAEGGYYDGQTFHRIVPNFVIQGGDPRGDGTGGPGYQIDAEFSDRPHLEGVLSMARGGDPNEASGMMPRSDFANSAGSQFFICLDYNQTKSLDGKYTAFGRITDGMETVKKIAAAPIADQARGRPREPQVIEKVEVKSVVPGENPYAGLQVK